MDLNLIKRLVKIVDSSGVTDLEIEQDGVRIKIAKKIRNSQTPSQVFQTNPVVEQFVPETKIQTEANKVIESHKEKEEEKIAVGETTPKTELQSAEEQIK